VSNHDPYSDLCAPRSKHSGSRVMVGETSDFIQNPCFGHFEHNRDVTSVTGVPNIRRRAVSTI